jgi:hypothetical protein
VREGDVTGMPLCVVTSSGCSGGPRWITTPGIEVSMRGSSADPGDGHVNRLVVLAPRRQAEDRGPLPVVDRAHLPAGEVHVDGEPVVPGELELVYRGVVEGGGESRQSGLLEPLGETPFALVWIHRGASVVHAAPRPRRHETRSPDRLRG